MKNLMKAVLMFIVAFGFVATTMAADAPAKVKATKMSGQVTAVDAAAKTVTVKGKDSKEVTLMVTNRTKIMHGKEKLSLTDIQSGTKVTAMYVADGDKMTAKSINIGGAKKNK
jgi:Cu/Ag efflux protein CusF